jgi:glycosyltransferase involved in cell wall biosynthesis
MKITLIFAKFNGEYTLPQVFNSLLEMTYPPCEWNIICINNNSIDSTEAILKSYEKKPPLTVLNQAKPGKNAALNMGIRDLNNIGDLVIFTDDDVVFLKGFLIQYYKLFTQHDKYYKLFTQHDKYQIFGRNILPLW